jgi:chemotaxis signal transduction protein
VIDLAFRLGLSRDAPYRLDTPILLCKDEQKTIGLIVDKVIGLETVTKENLQLQNDFNQNHSIFKASILSKNEMFFLLDITTLFAISVMSIKISYAEEDN